MKRISAEKAKNINGGAYRCKLCGYTNKSYWKVYKNALGCVLLKGLDLIFPPMTVY